MEFLLQYLDDLDDLYGMVGLVGERLRNVTFFLLTILSIGVVAFLAAALFITT